MTPKEAKIAGASALQQTLVAPQPTIKRLVRIICFLHRHKARAEEMEDYCQDINVRLLEDDCRRLRSFKEQSAPRTWLAAVIRNYLINTWQRRKEEESVDDVDLTNLIYQPVQEEEIVIKEQHEQIDTLLGKLSEDDRQLFDLTCQDLSDAEIAKQMEIKVGLVRKHRYALIRKMQRLL